MHARVIVMGGGVAGVTLIAAPAGFAQATTRASVTAAQGEGAPAAKKEPTEVSKCVEEAVNSGQQAETCVKAESPLVPSPNELVWGSLSFLVLFVLLAKLAYPGIKKTMDARAERIRKSLDEADSTRTEAQGILDEYKRQLSDAKSEAARIIDEARQAADKLRQDLKAQAESEVAEIKERADQDIRAQADRIMADMHGKVAELAIEAAEKVVERSLDRETNLALIESYINQVGSQR